MSACLDDNLVAAYVDGALAGEEVARVDSHIEGCAVCADQLAMLARVAAVGDEAAPTAALGPAPRALDPHAERYCMQCDSSYPDDALHCPFDGTRLVRLSERADPYVGKTIGGRFFIVEKLGQGGMGTVYRAVQQDVERDVAIKMIDPRLGDDRISAKRFLREVKLTSRINHVNSVTVIDFGQTDDDRLFLVMELLEGETLARRLRRQGALPLERAIHIAAQICDALEVAHKHKIIHRDLKPANVMILADPPGRDTVKVLDFGVARSLVGDETTMTRTDVMIGTPQFLPPELGVGATAPDTQPDERADLYSLGVMLYLMVAGRLPFEAQSLQRLLLEHAEQPPPPLGDTVSPEVERVIFRLLAKRPDDRYGSASEVREALFGLLRDSVAPRPRRRSRAWRMPAVALGVAAIAAVVGMFVLRGREPAAPAPARPAAASAPAATDVETSTAAATAPAPVVRPLATAPDAGPSVAPAAAEPKKNKRVRQKPTRPEYFTP